MLGLVMRQTKSSKDQQCIQYDAKFALLCVCSNGTAVGLVKPGPGELIGYLGFQAYGGCLVDVKLGQAAADRRDR